MVKWDRAVEEAKNELGIHGWTNRWNEVIILAKEKYWDGDDFRILKEVTLEEADNTCLLCRAKIGLTAHHVIYGRNEETVCLCRRCHEIVHSPEIKYYGFVAQLVLLNWYHWPENLPNNLLDMAIKCKESILKLIEKKDDQ